MRVEYEFRVDAAASVVRGLLADVERSAACVPGLSLEAYAPGEYGGRLRLRVGSTTVTFRGTTTVSSADDTFRLEIDGQEARGTGVAKGTVTVSLTRDGNVTRVSVDADLTVTGRLGAFEPPVLSDAIRRLFDRFGECVIAAVAVEEADIEAGVGPEGGIAVTRRPSDRGVSSQESTPSAEPGGGRARRGKAGRTRTARDTAGARRPPAAGPSPAARRSPSARPSPAVRSTSRTPAATEPASPETTPVSADTMSGLTPDMTGADDDDLLAAEARRGAWPLRLILLWLAGAAAFGVAIQFLLRRRHRAH